MRTERDVEGEKNAAIGSRRHGLDSPFDVGKTMDMRDDRLDGKRSGSILKRPPAESCSRVIRIVDHRNMRHIWRNFFKRLQHIADNREFSLGKSSDVATRPGKAFHPASSDRIGTTWDNDRN